MAHYRKIDTRILLDKKFNALSSDARLVFFHLLAHINLTALGAMRASVPGLADELNWEVARFESALVALCQNDMAHYDKTARFLWLPNFLKYNVPESPNVVKSWETALSYLPECDLRDALVVHVQQFVAGLSVSFQEALPDCFQVVIPSSQNDAAMSSVSKSETAFGEMLSESHFKKVTTPSESLTKAIENSSESQREGIKTPSENPLDPLSEGSFENRLSLPESLSIKHKALNNKHKTLSIKQEEERKLIQENHLEEKEEIVEIKNIVALTQQKNPKKPPDAEVVEVFTCWQQTLGHPHAVLDGKRRKRIRQALASGYSVAQLCDAILGCSQTPHNMGDNEQGQRFDGLHVILRDADQIDRFIRNAHSPPKKQNVADKTITTGRSWLDKKIREKQAQTEKTIYECA